jgi:cytochrome P450 family 4 subfamily V
MAIAVVTLVTLIVLYLLYHCYQRYQIIRKINKIPGLPNSTSGFGIRSAILFSRITEFGSGSAQVCQRIGQFLTAPNLMFPGGMMKAYAGPAPVVIIWRPDLVQSFISQHKNEIRKGFTYQFMTFMGNGLVTSHGDKWRHDRKLLTPAFHFKILEHAIPVMNKNADILVKKMNEARLQNADGIIEDISQLVLLCSLDVISESAMGQEMHSQSKSESAFVRYNRTISAGFMDRGLKPWLHSDFTFGLSSIGRKFNQDVAGILKIVDSVINVKQRQLDQQQVNKTPVPASNEQVDQQVDEKSEEKSPDSRSEDDGPPAFMDVMLKLHQESPDQVSMQDLRDQVLTFMAAGYETTGWTVAWAIYQLSLNPEVQQRLFEELDQELEPGQEITYEMAKTGLPFTEAVMKETLRLYPAVPLFARQLEHDIVINGYEIPAPTNIGINLIALHRHPDHWDQPDRFMPDRFCNTGVSHHPFAYIPFSAGLRNCIGQRYAMMEGKLLIAKIFRKFRITAADPNAEVQTRASIVLAAASAIRVRLEVRE